LVFLIHTELRCTVNHTHQICQVCVLLATVWDDKRRFYSGRWHRLLVFQTKYFLGTGFVSGMTYAGRNSVRPLRQSVRWSMIVQLLVGWPGIGVLGLTRRFYSVSKESCFPEGKSDGSWSWMDDTWQVYLRVPLYQVNLSGLLRTPAATHPGTQWIGFGTRAGMGVMEETAVSYSRPESNRGYSTRCPVTIVNKKLLQELMPVSSSYV
jgi:hypothetical protein